MLHRLSLEQETLERERQELQLQRQRLQARAEEHRRRAEQRAPEVAQAVLRQEPQQPQPRAVMQQELPPPMDVHHAHPYAVDAEQSSLAPASGRVECGKELSTNSTRSTRVVSMLSHDSSQACGKMLSTASASSTGHAVAEDEDEDEYEGTAVRTASRGSAGHPDGCAKACKFVSTKRGCKDGADCDHCHLCTWRCQLRVRRRPAKRS